MSFSFPLDELGVVNRCLALTGDNLVAAAEDGSDEWLAGDAGYQTGFSYASESHSWGFATQVKVLPASPTAPQDTAWDTAYLIPSDCIHIIWVKINQDNASSPPFSGVAVPTLYDIMGTPAGPVIVINAQGGPPPPNPPAAPAQVTVKYVSNAGPLCDPSNATPTLILALQSFTMSGIYRGLHEDVTEADKMWMAGEHMLQMARTRYDQQKPKRQFFNSRITASRRIRRPFPALGNGNWSGSNTPG